MTTVIVASHNPGKVVELQAYLQACNWKLQLMPPELEIDETGTTFVENAALKATTAAQTLGHWAIADDSGLMVDALDGAPGLFSARYGSSDSDRIARLLREMGDTAQRQAQFVCALALANPKGEVVVQTTGYCSGEILTAPQGRGGFGYDPVFYIPSLKLTFAEMSAEQKHQLSHRGVAMQSFWDELTKKGLIELA